MECLPFTPHFQKTFFNSSGISPPLLSHIQNWVVNKVLNIWCQIHTCFIHFHITLWLWNSPWNFAFNSSITARRHQMFIFINPILWSASPEIKVKAWLQRPHGQPYSAFMLVLGLTWYKNGHGQKQKWEEQWFEEATFMKWAIAHSSHAIAEVSIHMCIPTHPLASIQASNKHYHNSRPFPGRVKHSRHRAVLMRGAEWGGGRVRRKSWRSDKSLKRHIWAHGVKIQGPKLKAQEQARLIFFLVN